MDPQVIAKVSVQQVMIKLQMTAKLSMTKKLAVQAGPLLHCSSCVMHQLCMGAGR